MNDLNQQDRDFLFRLVSERVVEIERYIDGHLDMPESVRAVLEKDTSDLHCLLIRLNPGANHQRRGGGQIL